MQIDLTTEQIHWAKYAIINAIAALPPDADEVRQILMSVLKRDLVFC